MRARSGQFGTPRARVVGTPSTIPKKVSSQNLLPHQGSANNLLPHSGSGSLLVPRSASGLSNKDNSTSPRMLLPIPPMTHSTSDGAATPGGTAIAMSPRTPGSTRKNKRYGVLLETPTKKDRTPRGDGGADSGKNSGNKTPGSDAG